MENIIIYVSGKDRMGIISDITKEISQLNGNIETSKMIKLGHDFNMLILASINEQNFNTLEKKLLLYKDLSISIKKTKRYTRYKENEFIFTLKGADNEGIVHNCTKLFHKLDINVIDLETKLLNAPITGSPLFYIKALIYLTDREKLDLLKQNMILLENENNVVVKLQSNDKTNH
jgi:glycine cleavage system transcriptional repressor